MKPTNPPSSTQTSSQDDQQSSQRQYFRAQVEIEIPLLTQPVTTQAAVVTAVSDRPINPGDMVILHDRTFPVRRLLAPSRQIDRPDGTECSILYEFIPGLHSTLRLMIKALDESGMY